MVALYSDAAAHLAAAAPNLRSDLGTSLAEAATDILYMCQTTITGVADILQKVDPAETVDLADDIDQAIEIITLLELEGGARPAIDAVQLLVNCAMNLSPLRRPENIEPFKPKARKSPHKRHEAGRQIVPFRCDTRAEIATFSPGTRHIVRPARTS